MSYSQFQFQGYHIRNRSHNVTAAQLLKQLRQPLLDHLLDLIVLVVLLLLVLTTMLLPTVLLSAVLLSAMLLSAPSLLSVLLTIVLTTILLLPRVSTTTVLRVLRGRRHTVHSTALEVYVNTTLVLLSLVLQPKLTADLLDAGFDLLDVIAAVVSLADNDV